MCGDPLRVAVITVLEVRWSGILGCIFTAEFYDIRKYELLISRGWASWIAALRGHEFSCGIRIARWYPELAGVVSIGKYSWIIHRGISRGE